MYSDFLFIFLFSNFMFYEHITWSGSDSDAWDFRLKIIFQVLVQDQVQDRVPGSSISFPMSIFMYRFRCRGSIVQGQIQIQILEVSVSRSFFQDHVQDQVLGYTISYLLSIIIFRFRCRGSNGFQSWVQVLIQGSVGGEDVTYTNRLSVLTSGSDSG